MIYYSGSQDFNVDLSTRQERLAHYELQLSGYFPPNEFVIPCENRNLTIKRLSGNTWEVASTSDTNVETHSYSLHGLSKKTADSISQDGVERLRQFSAFQEGWNFGAGNRLSKESLITMDYFVNQISQFHTVPSIFMNCNGNLLLGWEDNSGGEIELEFYANHIEYFIETLSEENSIDVDRDQIDALVRKLNLV